MVFTSAKKLKAAERSASVLTPAALYADKKALQREGTSALLTMNGYLCSEELRTSDHRDRRDNIGPDYSYSGPF